MADIDRIITVNITKATVAPSLGSFGVMLVAAEFLAVSATPTYGTARTRTYTSLADIATAFGTSHIVYKMAVKIFAQSPAPSSILVGRKLTSTDGSETWTQCLTAIQAETSQWYGLVCGNRTEADQQLIATWVEANKKLCLLASSDGDIISSSGDIAAYLQTNNFTRTGVMYHPLADLTLSTDPFPDCALMAKMVVKDPGSATWAYKNLAGVSSYYLTGTQIGVALGKNANIYTAVGGVDVTQFGTVGNAEYFDVTMGLDYLQTKIQELIYGTLIGTDKIPYTNAGIQMVVSQLKAALYDAQKLSILDQIVSVTFPDIDDVSSADKAARTLTGVQFIATLAGAIHKTTINGYVSL